MDGEEWESIDTAERGKALMLAGVPDREGEEANMYEPQEWESLPLDVQDKLLLLPANWRKLNP